MSAPMRVCRWSCRRMKHGFISPIYGNGQGFTSDAVLINLSATRTVAGKVAYSDDEGNQMSVDVAAREGGSVPLTTTDKVHFSIPPLGAVTISTDGQGPVTSGAVVVTSDRPLGGVIRFNIPGIGVAGVGASPPLSRFIIPVSRKAGSINTGDLAP